jgi:plasmid maintenance system antidote protein VapI
MIKKFVPIHPGKIQQEESHQPGGISQSRFAKKISVHSRRHLNRIIHELNLRARYDLGGGEGKLQLG